MLSPESTPHGACAARAAPSGLTRRTIVSVMFLGPTAGCKEGAFDKPAQMAASPQQIYGLASQASGFEVGTSKAAPVYVFFDPQCPHCATLWRNAKPLLDRAQVVWIPVAILRPSSAPQGAAILSAPNPVAAMDEHEASIRNREGGISAFGAPSEAREKVDLNTDLLKAAGYRKVPLIAYRNRITGDYGAQTGALTTDQLAALIGL